MDEEHAFLNAIAADLENDLPRLVFADWLDEHDRPEMAEFLRVQCELEPNRDLYEIAGVTELHEREEALWKACGQPQVERFREVLELRHYQVGVEVRRGFLHTVKITATDFLGVGERIRPTFPTAQRLRLFRAGEHTDALAQCEHFGHFPDLELPCWYPPETAEAIAGSRHLSGVKKLTIWLGGSTDQYSTPSADLVRLFAARAWPDLRELVLFDPWTGEDVAPLVALANELAGRPLARAVTPDTRFPLAAGFSYFCPGKLADGRRTAARPVGDRIHVIVFGDDDRMAEKYDLPQTAAVAEFVKSFGSLYGTPRQFRQAVHDAVGSVPAFIRVGELYWPDGEYVLHDGPETHHDSWGSLGWSDPGGTDNYFGNGGEIDWIVNGGQFGCSGAWCDKSGHVHST